MEKNDQPSGAESLRLLRAKAKDGTLKDVVRDWKWILSFSRKYWVRILLYTLLGVGASAISLVSSVLSKYLIDAIVSMDKGLLLNLAAAMVATAVISVAFRSFSARFSARLGVDMQNLVRGKAFEALLNARWMEISRFSTGDLVNRFTSDVHTVASCAVTWLPNVIIQLFTLLATLAVVLYYDPVMALIAFASTPVLFLASRHLMRKQRRFNKDMRQVSSGISAFETETFRNADTLKSFGVEGDMVQKMEDWQERYRDVALEYNRFTVQTNIWLTAMGTAVQYVAMGYCLWRMWRGEILFGTMVLFLQQRSYLSSAFSSLVGQVPTALSGSVAAERVRELMDLEKEARQPGPKARPQGKCRVALEDVCVSYGQEKEVVSHVDITAEPGRIISLVGPSGEGKSTLMRLMLGLVEPRSGQAYLEDEAGARFRLGPDTRHLIAYVPQGNTVLAGTIAENLRLVAPDVTEEEMIAALRDACAWDFVSQLPNGIHSTLGEGGKGISEGQAQRIAIARALVRKAPVLLLDEVTSALDMETEQKVLKNLVNRGVTTIAATHRTSVLTQSHRVYRVQDGAVAQLTADQVDRLIRGGE